MNQLWKSFGTSDRILPNGVQAAEPPGEEWPGCGEERRRKPLSAEQQEPDRVKPSGGEAALSIRPWHHYAEDRVRYDMIMSTYIRSATRLCIRPSSLERRLMKTKHDITGKNKGEHLGAARPRVLVLPKPRTLQGKG